MNKFIEMETYIAIVEAGSITEAAKRIGTTKSVISQRMQKLEKRLGASLLNRGRTMTLTDTGREFYHNSIQLLSKLTEIEDTVRTTHTSLTGTLRIAVPNDKWSFPYKRSVSHYQ